MTGEARPFTSWTGLYALGAVGLALAVGACSSTLSTGSGPAPASTGGSFTDRVGAFFLGSPPPATPGTPRSGDDEVDCPPVDVRQGTSTLGVNAPGQPPSPMTLRYQASVSQTARECLVTASSLTIKVGVQGRIILGPLGAPGQFDVPLRLALVQEGPEPKTIWTKLYRVSAAVPPGQTNAPFVHVEENLTVPRPKGAEIDAYVVYVGFDQLGAKEKPQKPPRRRRPG